MNSFAESEGRCPVLVENLIEVARMAGLGLMKYYTTKQSSLSYTEVDLARATSLRILVLGLRAHYPHIPIVCEHGESEETCRVHSELFSPSDTKGNTSHHCFCICPLDGEKDFIRRISSGFAVTIGFCLNGEPVVGVVCAPATTPSEVYFSVKGIGAYIESAVAHAPSPLRVVAVPDRKPRIVAAESSKYATFIKSLSTDGTYDSIRPPAAVSLRFMLIATGNSHIFPVLHTSSEWESCAGQAIVTAAGGHCLRVESDVLNSPRRKPIKRSDGTNVFDDDSALSASLRYGKPVPLNDAFIVFGALTPENTRLDAKKGVNNVASQHINYTSQECLMDGLVTEVMSITEIAFDSLPDADEALTQTMLEFIQRGNSNKAKEIENSEFIELVDSQEDIISRGISSAQLWTLAHAHNYDHADVATKATKINEYDDVDDIHDEVDVLDTDADRQHTQDQLLLLTVGSTRWEVVGFVLAAVIPLLTSILYAYFYV